MFGIEHFLSDHKGFKGIIKQRCSDFGVTEIDESGVLVQLNPPKEIDDWSKELSEEWHRGQKSDQETLKTARAPKDTKIHENASQTKIPEPSSSKESAWKEVEMPEATLKKYLSNTLFSSLSLFAMDMKDKKDITKEISLGQFDEKSIRFLIHLCIKKLHPHLKTTSTKNQETGAQEICVKYNTVHGELSDIVGSHDADSIMCFVHCEEKSKNSVLNLTVDKDRTNRTMVHRFLSKHFGSFMESKTMNCEKTGEAFIQLRFRNKLKRSHSVMTGDSSKDVYTSFVLQKENMETLDAIHVLCKQLNTKPSVFSYAGIKDKRAVTLQTMVVKGVPVKRLQALQEQSGDTSSLRVGNIKSCDTPLRLGQLAGNQFRIVLRNVQPASQGENVREAIQEAMENVKRRGFVNYFGLQRFGLESKAVNAQSIGLAMLQGKMAEAVRLFFLADEDSNHAADLAKRYFTETGDVPGTIKRMPEYKTRECLILKALHRHGKAEEGCTKALLNLPYAMRLFYVHSYCSLIWNEMVSLRLQLHGHKLVPGDLVLEKDANVSTDTKEKIKIITSTEIENEEYSFQDIVLPQPGYNITLPNNDIRQRYIERLREDGLSWDSFRVRKLSLNVPGAYRKVISFPKNLTWSWYTEDSARNDNEEEENRETDSKDEEQCKYANKKLKTQHENLNCGTDVESSGVPLPNCGKSEQKSERGVHCHRNNDQGTVLLRESDGEMKTNSQISPQNNILVLFQLDAANYATMCLREIMRS